MRMKPLFRENLDEEDQLGQLSNFRSHYKSRIRFDRGAGSTQGLGHRFGIANLEHEKVKT